MKTAQLSLIEELNLVHNKDFTPPTPARKFTPPSSVAHSFVLHALRSGPQPMEQLQRAAGANDGAVLLEELRKLGLELPSYDVPEVTTNAEARTCAVCMLTSRDVRRIDRWIKAMGAGHV